MTLARPYPARQKALAVLDSVAIFAVIRRVPNLNSGRLRFMSCALCGDICRCSSLTETCAPSEGNPSAFDISPAWRQEVAARLNRYQARRKPRPPRYPSLRLRFEEPHIAIPEGCTPAFPAPMPPVCNQALALDQFTDNPGPAIRVPACDGSVQHASAAIVSVATPVPATAKIIEFPRSWTPPAPPVDELAEAVTDRPRILEAPEIVPPPPALGGITIEPAPQAAVEKRPGIDIPLQSAPLARRIFSASVDAVIIVVGCLLFGSIFWKLTGFRPPPFQAIALAFGLFGLFWAAYEYLLLIYSGSTPGLRLARLELARFDGTPARRRLRRWRVLASFLSAISLGMGYAWVFLDEDSLCWHDRITHTYLAPRA